MDSLSLLPLPTKIGEEEKNDGCRCWQVKGRLARRRRAAAAAAAAATAAVARIMVRRGRFSHSLVPSAAPSG